MFNYLDNILKPVSSIVGKVLGNKEQREKSKQNILSKEIDYRQSKLKPFLYSSMVVPFVLMWLSFGFYPILKEITIPVLNRIAIGYIDILEKFGLDNLTNIILIFLGLGGVTLSNSFKGIKLGDYKKELKVKNKIKEQDKNLSYDIQKLMLWEGSVNEGYVPIDKDENNNSGVTIGMGVDLGHQNIEELEKAMLHKHIIDDISVYIGVKGIKAKQLIKKIPLVMNVNDTCTLNQVVLSIYVRKVRKLYNHKFWIYPAEVQTVILSRAWHGGVQLNKSDPKFYKATINEDWEKMEKVLRNYYPKNKKGIMPYYTRLNQEADLIKRIL